ncbi:energy transducer TonB [Marinobacter sp. VGCF2001]|uniref:energy transducer TonB n=1 Tax=Marinobacter sp. VGCF2001 TaxID=3417189 RepID=UPI003CEF8071
MTTARGLAKLLILLTALIITAATIVLAVPRKVPEMPVLGDSAVNTAPAIRISLAGKKTATPAAEPEPAPVARTPQPPEPKPEPKPKPDPEPKPKPKPEPVQKPKPAPKPETAPEPDPSPEPEPEATPTPPKATTEPVAETPEQPAGQEAESHVRQSAIPLQNAGQSSQVDSYLSKLSRHLARFYDYPRRARRLGQEGTPVILFEFRRDGSLVSHSLRDSSGHPLLDNAALEMLAQAAPLPAVPDSMQGRVFTYALPVRFRLR